jgi:RNA polymerase sigma-70 factor, ECF subfamily
MTTTLHRPADLEPQLERHRRELTGYCRRVLGSTSEAEDAVQETLVRAWRGFDHFEGRSALRSWLYRIATNVCIDMQRGPQRRARPVDMSPSTAVESAPADSRPDGVVAMPDPADQAVARDTVRQAFATALRHLPPRQRAVLVLREVLRWKATEVAELLDATVPSVNSLLQRARATLAAVSSPAIGSGAEWTDEANPHLLGRYVEAFGRSDMDSLVALLRDDARNN